MDESTRPRPGPGPAPSDGSPTSEPGPDATLRLPAVPPAPPALPTEPPVSPPPPSPGPAPRPRHPRRWFLAGALAVVAGGGAGTGAAFLRHRSTPHRPLPPPALAAAAAAERALIADLVATTGGARDVRVAIAQATANHRAHLAALDALLGQYRRPAASPSPVPGTPRTRGELRAAEAAAATASAGRALHLDRQFAVLLASIAACEATHAELLR